MKANATPLVALFEKKMRLEVPLFQRQYVWSVEQQWEPLWEDIERKFTEYLEGRTDAPVHFLGAIVLDQKQTPATHVERRLVIDGQQRLTTLQVFLVAFRDFCAAAGAEALAEECRNFTLNKGMMPDPEVDKFKVWPTQADRKPFQDVVTAGSPEALEKLHPLVFKKYARKPDPRPKLIECYLFFYKCLDGFINGSFGDDPVGHQTPVGARLEECFQALRNSLLVVSIDLEPGDDAQVIFETLNARGEPLLPADLLRNYIFLRAARQEESQEDLYKNYWQPFDEDFWRVEVSQGRINRPRSDLFMQHFLASQQTIDIPIKHLYVEYRHWIEKEKPFTSVRDELAALAINRDNFRRITEAEPDQAYTPLARLLEAFDIGTAYPLMLFLLDAVDDTDDLVAICSTLESYLIRRAICGLTNKNYNRVFLTLTRTLRRDGASLERLRDYLTGLQGESTEWPTDDAFREGWRTRELYHQLNTPRLSYILRRLNALHISSKSEDFDIRSPLTIEHIMPQGWVANWPLADGSAGMNTHELWDAGIVSDDPRAQMTRTRNTVIHTIGNLTILSQGLNSSVSNAAWPDKKPELLKYSLLPINQGLYGHDHWDETTIAERGEKLFAMALELWPR